jgi:serine/threonine protein kinase
MPVTAAPTVEAPLGYTLLERLGAGGYGEVWKATAPGGMEKAVKVVFGHCEEELAGRELKALDRIRSVRHPFLLTIERYEIVNHRLVIVSELADMSLDARFRQTQESGLPGIPREELLGYLSDAAEALDWLSERYSLQHLDIKPENLLILGEHVKVGDFGLVKDIASRTNNSLVGGMTPVYSAPEIYDDAPCHRSDQYSLAIVYQQMLSGKLPFPGKTPAQLAKQHMQAQPNLSPLCEADRPAIARALEKSPTARFESCRDLIAALKQDRSYSSASQSKPAAGVSLPRSPDQSEDDTRSMSSLSTEPRPQQEPPRPQDVLDKGCVLTGAPLRKSEVVYPVVSHEVVEVDPPKSTEGLLSAPCPTLFIGIGGVGLDMLARTQAALDGLPGAPHASKWLAIDTDPATLKSISGGEGKRTFPREDLLHIPLRRPREYREESQDLLKWLSRRWLYNIPRSLQTRGYRPLGRLALVDHADSVLRAIADRLTSLEAAKDSPSAESNELRVVILAGACGGTGSGCAIDLGQAARSVGRQLGKSLRVQVMLGSTFAPEHPDSLAAANMYTLLTELDYAQQHGNQSEGATAGTAACFELPESPFDQVRIVSISGRTDPAKREQALKSVVDSFSIEARADLSPLVSHVRARSIADDTPFSLETHGCIDLAAIADSLATRRLDGLVNGFLDYCLETVSEHSPGADQFGELSHSRFAQSFLKALSRCGGPDASPDTMEEAQQWRKRRIANAVNNLKGLADLRNTSTPDDSTASEHAAPTQAFERLMTDICLEVGSHGETKLISRDELEAHVQRFAPEETDASQFETVMLHAAEISNTCFEQPLNCGFHRMRALIDPGNRNLTLLQNAPQSPANPTGILQGPIRCFLVSIGSGILPIHLAARLADSFPGIAEAAGRLHSRSDIEWKPLSD